MRLDTDLVRRLGSSQFNYWFGYIANGGWVFWLATRGFAQESGALLPSSFLAYILAGIALWTLAEYLLHRYVYHVIPSFLSQGHMLHHRAPRELIGVPWWLTSFVLYAVFNLAALRLHAGKVGAVMAGAWFGYIVYCLLHHGSHHWCMHSGYLRRVKQRHQLHHAYPDTNWGFTTPLWDIIFGTYLAPSVAKERSRLGAGSNPASHVRRRAPTRCAQAEPKATGVDMSFPST